MTIDLSKYTAGALTTADYIAMLKRRKDHPPMCPTEAKWWRRHAQIERETIKPQGNPPYSPQFMRYLDDYGFRTGIY